MTNPERQQIRQLLQDPRFAAVEHLVEELINKIRDQTMIDDTEWGTIRRILTIEGEARGIRRLVQEMYEQAKKIN